jgi:hypothetical protein
MDSQDTSGLAENEAEQGVPFETLNEPAPVGAMFSTSGLAERIGTHTVGLGVTGVGVIVGVFVRVAVEVGVVVRVAVAVGVGVGVGVDVEAALVAVGI